MKLRIYPSTWPFSRLSSRNIAGNGLHAFIQLGNIETNYRRIPISYDGVLALKGSVRNGSNARWWNRAGLCDEGGVVYMKRVTSGIFEDRLTLPGQMLSLPASCECLITYRRSLIE